MPVIATAGEAFAEVAVTAKPDSEAVYASDAMIRPGFPTANHAGIRGKLSILGNTRTAVDSEILAF
jgi:hypothetical protein